MRILTLAIFILSLNVATSMLAVSGAFPEGVAPQNIDQLGDKLANMTSISPPTGGFNIIDVAMGLGVAVTNFIELVVNTPTAFAFFVGETIPNNPVTNQPYPIETIFVGGMVLGCWATYLMGIVQLLVRFKMED